MKKLVMLCLPFAVIISSCSKKLKTDGCPTGQICTMIFTSLGTEFVDKDGKNVAVKDFKVFNTRTGKFIAAKGVVDPGFSPTQHTIITDGNKKEVSTEGDELRITATSVSTGKAITAVYKIAGGCNCHVEKLSGPEKIVVE